MAKADVTKEAEVIRMMKSGRQAEILSYLYQNFNGDELMQLSQIGTRLTAVADSVSARKTRERNARKRMIGGNSGAAEGFVQV